MGPGEQDLDLDAPIGRGAEASADLGVGHEVGGGDADASDRELDERAKEDVDVAPARLGRSPDALHHRRTRLRLLREGVDVTEELGCRLAPVVEERGAEAVDRGAVEPKVGVPPLALVPGVTGPLVGDAHPAREGHLLVHDEHLAVGAVVHLQGAEPVQWPEPADVDLGVGHVVEEPAVHGARPERVEQDSHADPCPRPGTQPSGQLLADLALPIDEGQEVDGALGGVDGLEHRREDLVAVAQDLDAVAFRGRCSQDALEVPAEPPDLSLLVARFDRRRRTVPVLDPAHLVRAPCISAPPDGTAQGPGPAS